MDPDKVEAILNWPVPKNAYEVISFHGISSNFYRKIINTFSHICAPLIDTFIGSRHPFKWTEAANRNFKLLKKKITKSTFVFFPSLPFSCELAIKRWKIEVVEAEVGDSLYLILRRADIGCIHCNV